MASVLVIGESWFIHTTHQKGFDSFTTSEYVEGAQHFLDGLRDDGNEVTYVPAHLVDQRCPTTADAFAAYDAVILSDVGANTFLLGRSTFADSAVAPNRLLALAEYVRGGGSLLMVGGYMSFAGIDGRARYGSSPLAGVLPVRVSHHDDRVEMPEGVIPRVCGEHHIVAGLPEDWPVLLGYNLVEPRADADVLVRCGHDPLLVVGSAGEGRVAAFTSDIAPHWAPPAFVAWDGYRRLWHQLVGWLANATVGAR